MRDNQTYQIKQQPMPQNIDAEQALIGAILVNNGAYARVANIIETAHFFEEIHQQIWYVISKVIEKGQVVTPISLKTYLGDEEIAEGVTPQVYLSRLAAGATTVANAPDYARTVRDLALRRKIIGIAEKAAAKAYDAPVEATAESLYSELEGELEKARPALSAEDSEFTDFASISNADIYEAYKTPDRITGLETGLPRLDHILGGMQDSDLIILAGRPSMGKTALATNIVLNVAKRVLKEAEPGKRPGTVGVFSLEMSAKQLKMRIMADLADIPLWKLKKGASTDEEMRRFYEVEREFSKLPLSIDQTGGLTIGQLKMRARTLKKRKGLSLLMVDYLQLLSGDGRTDSRTTEVTQITTGLKALAKELNVPIIALSQVSREVEKTDDKRPQLQHLRESGSIEQDADVVMFVFREEYYVYQRKQAEGTEAWDRWQRELRRVAGHAEVIIAKNRQGAQGTAIMGFDGEHTRFTNFPPERPAEPEEARQKLAEKGPKGQNMNAAGQTMRKIIMDLSFHEGMQPTAAQKEHDKTLHLHSRLVRRDSIVKEFSKLYADDTEDNVRKLINSGAANLRVLGMTKLFRDADETDYVYLIDTVAK